MPDAGSHYADLMPATTELPPRPRRPFGAPAWSTDLAVVVLALAAPTIGLAFSHRGGRHGLRTVDLVAVLAFLPLLALRRRHPITVFVLAAAATTVITALSGERTVAFPATLLLLFSMATRTPRTRALTVGVAAIAVMFAAAAARLDHRWFTPDSFAILAWSGFALAAGDAIRNRREYVAAIEERARRAEETRETEARRRVIEERLRIARELHDVVAHHMAVINVQAGVASHLVRTDAAGTEQALGVVRDAGRAVLDELSGLLNVLRNADDEIAPAAPMPTLREIDDLVTSFAAAGLAVTLQIEGAPVPLTDALQLTVYRIVEEALTNAHKHGTGTATVAIEHRPTEIDLRIENELAARTGADEVDERPSGHGTVGMRERVTAMHGRLTLGPVGTRFVVHATIPHHRSTP